MPDTSALEIPDRPLFKAAEVCELLKLQPYVLKSWEAEFPELGVAKSAGSPRVYRRNDIEQVLRIKHLLLVEGLTLAGARRKLEAEAAAPVADDEAAIDELFPAHARERLTEIRKGLRSILDLLSGSGAGSEFHLEAPADTNGRKPAGKSAAAPKAKSPTDAAAGGKRKRSA